MSNAMRRIRPVFLLLILFSLTMPAGAQWFETPERPQRGQAASSSGGFTILLTNDDGYDAPGLRALAEALQPLGEIQLSAPAGEQSGKGHSIVTSREPILIRERKQPNGTVWYAVEGPPATCVRVAIEALLPHRPDIVISGINRGENLGMDVYYSGTVGGAREAALVGLPAIAVSMRGDNEKDYAAAAAFVRQLVEQLRDKQMLKPGLFLNVNVPPGERRGVRVARLSLKPSQESYDRRTSPRGRVYFWSQYRQHDDDEEGTDLWAFVRGYITLTPMRLDATATQAMDALRAFESPAAVPATR